MSPLPSLATRTDVMRSGGGSCREESEAHHRITDSQGFTSKSSPPHHEIGEDGNPNDAHHEGNGVVSLPVLVLRVRDAAPHGDHQGQGKSPHDLADDGITGSTTDVIHVRLLSFLLCTFLLLHLQRLLRFVLFPVLQLNLEAFQSDPRGLHLGLFCLPWTLPRISWSNGFLWVR